MDARGALRMLVGRCADFCAEAPLVTEASVHGGLVQLTPGNVARREHREASGVVRIDVDTVHHVRVRQCSCAAKE